MHLRAEYREIILRTDYALADWINKAADNNIKLCRLSRLLGGVLGFFS